jgi:hypothetical protein
MKLTAVLLSTISILLLISPSAKADGLGDVIRNTLRGEIRDGVVDSVRRDICRRRAEENRDEDDQSDDFCEAWEDIDRLGDALRRGSNGIRALDAIFN